MSRIGLFLFGTTIFLALFGVFILYETSPYVAQLQIGDKYHFVKNQALWMVLGIVLSLIVSRLKYKSLYALALPALVGSMALLILVFFPGIGLNLKGAHRWLSLGFFVIQPSELLKITLTLYLAAWLTNPEKKKLGAFLLLFLICVFLVIIQPDMGTAIIIGCTAILVYFLSGASFKEMVVIGLLLVVGAFSLVKVSSYRSERFASFINFDSKNVSKASYHTKQVLIAMGNGGLTGAGFGKSIQKYAYVPESTTDSIFAIYAEESGFIGSIFLLSVYFILLVLGFLITARAKDKFGMLLAAGITCFIGVQVLVNLASQVVLIPLTGVPLPFVSYGGSSMVINFAAVGVLLSVGRKV